MRFIRWCQCRIVVAVVSIGSLFVVNALVLAAIPKTTLARGCSCLSAPIRSPLLSLYSSSSSSSPSQNDGGDQEMNSLLASLKSRQAELKESAMAQTAKLRNPKVSSKVAVLLDDWVRRIAVDYPWIACGSASSRIYLANLETGKILAQTKTESMDNVIETSQPCFTTTIDADRLEHVIHQLYGQYDGGGTLAIGLSGDLICSASRTGGVTLHRWVRNASDGLVTLIAQGTLNKDQLVTAIQFTSDSLIVGTDSGCIFVYELEDIALQRRPTTCWKLSASPIVTSLAVNEELGLIAAATDSGMVQLVGLDLETDHPIGSFSPSFDGTERRAQNAFPTCVTFVECSNSSIRKQESNVDSRVERDDRIAIACGSNDGSLCIKYLAFDGQEVDYISPFGDESDDDGIGAMYTLMPRHFAGVKCLASPGRDLLMSGGLDGSLRMWDVQERRLLYQFLGYKVWLGSLWTNGHQLCSDGSDNSIIVHHFLPESKT